ncbi:MAG: hypothetical protein L6R41_006307, partial [Letrouitia leprolyta]
MGGMPTGNVGKSGTVGQESTPIPKGIKRLLQSTMKRSQAVFKGGNMLSKPDSTSETGNGRSNISPSPSNEGSELPASQYYSTLSFEEKSLESSSNRNTPLEFGNEDGPLEESEETDDADLPEESVQPDASDLGSAPATIFSLTDFLGFKMLFQRIAKAAEIFEFIEQLPRNGLKRIKWTRVCGAKLYDDFKELSAGELDELQSFLNHDEECGGDRQAAGSSSAGKSGRSIRRISESAPQPSQAVSLINIDIGTSLAGDNTGTHSPGLRRRSKRSEAEASGLGQQAWILPIFQYNRYGTMVKHLRVDHITSDKDLFLNIKTKYHEQTSRSRHFSTLRGVKKISCVKFVHAAVEPDIH